MREKIARAMLSVSIPALLLRKIDITLHPQGFTSRAQLVHYALAKYLSEEHGMDFDELIHGSPWWPKS